MSPFLRRALIVSSFVAAAAVGAGAVVLAHVVEAIDRAEREHFDR